MPTNFVEGTMRVLARIKALRAEQRASGAPLFSCPICRGDSRRDAAMPVESITCECCGEPLTLRRHGDGWLIERRLGSPGCGTGRHIAAFILRGSASNAG